MRHTTDIDLESGDILELGSLDAIVSTRATFSWHMSSRHFPECKAKPLRIHPSRVCECRCTVSFCVYPRFTLCEHSQPKTAFKYPSHLIDNHNVL